MEEEKIIEETPVETDFLSEIGDVNEPIEIEIIHPSTKKVMKYAVRNFDTVKEHLEHDKTIVKRIETLDKNKKIMLKLPTSILNQACVHKLENFKLVDDEQAFMFSTDDEMIVALATAMEYRIVKPRRIKFAEAVYMSYVDPDLTNTIAINLRNIDNELLDEAKKK